MVKCGSLHQVVPKREEEERKCLGRWKKIGEEAGDSRRICIAPGVARPQGLTLKYTLASRCEFTKIRAVWLCVLGTNGDGGAGLAVWLGGGGLLPISCVYFGGLVLLLAASRTHILPFRLAPTVLQI